MKSPVQEGVAVDDDKFFFSLGHGSSYLNTGSFFVILNPLKRAKDFGGFSHMNIGILTQKPALQPA